MAQREESIPITSICLNSAGLECYNSEVHGKGISLSFPTVKTNEGIQRHFVKSQ